MKDHTTTLSLKTLHLFSPDLAADFEDQLTAASLDCRQQPSNPKPRDVTIRLRITPDPQDPGDVIIEPQTSRKTPARILTAGRARISKRHQLQFDFEDAAL